MATATITLKDDGEGSVDVTVDFGEPGSDDRSQAHHMALHMLRSQVERSTVIAEED